MIRSFDEAEGWKADGCLSCVDWLTRHTGVSTSTAYEHMRVARRLAELPLLDEAFAEGRLSYTKVRAIARVATPLTEEKLVEHGKTMSGEELERRCRSQRDADVAMERAKAERYLSRRTMGDGTVELRIRVDAAEAELVMKAIDEIRSALSRALLIRDEHCAYPGCSNHRWLDAHHIVHWSQGGETRMDNLCLLCTAHHRQAHVGAFYIEASDGTLRFYAADGTHITAPTQTQITHDPVWLLERIHPLA